MFDAGNVGIASEAQRDTNDDSGGVADASGDVPPQGGRRASEFLALEGQDREDLIRSAAFASLADPTVEGMSIVDFAADYGLFLGLEPGVEITPFTAQTRISGVDQPDGTQIRKGEDSAVLAWLESDAGVPPADLPSDLREKLSTVVQHGGTPLVVAVKTAVGEERILGVIHLTDIDAVLAGDTGRAGNPL